jgi:hypothetical protein
LLGKLMMTTGRTGILDQLFDDLLDPHTSFSNRMALVLETLQFACSLPSVQTVCSAYRSFLHPNFPPNLPLMMPVPKAGGVK